MNPSRQPAGIPAGGQFAPSAAPRPVVRLGSPGNLSWITMSTVQAHATARTLTELAAMSERDGHDAAASFYREQHRTLGLAVPAAGLPTIGTAPARGWRSMTDAEVAQVRHELSVNVAFSAGTNREISDFYRACQARLDETYDNQTAHTAAEPARRRWLWRR